MQESACLQKFEVEQNKFLFYCYLVLTYFLCNFNSTFVMIVRPVFREVFIHFHSIAVAPTSLWLLVAGSKCKPRTGG